MRLIPKNWKAFQHYNDRCPPWIKLHRDLLNDRAFMSLPIASKALAPLMWLLASESKDGAFDASTEELAFRLRLSVSEIEAGLKPLINSGFFLDASTMLAPCLQVATPERETETKRETEVSSKEDKSSGDDPLSVDEVVEAWNDIAERRKLPKVAKITPERRRKLKARIQQNTIDEWRLALEAIDRSSFLCGDNDRGWKANFDFLLQPSSFTKLIEGAYDR